MSLGAALGFIVVYGLWTLQFWAFWFTAAYESLEITYELFLVTQPDYRNLHLLAPIIGIMLSAITLGYIFLDRSSNLPSAEVSQPELMSIEYGPGERHRKGERRDEEAARYYEQALVIRREVGDRAGEGTTLGNLGMLAVSLGHVEEAIRYFEQALVIFTEIHDRR